MDDDAVSGKLSRSFRLVADPLLIGLIRLSLDPHDARSRIRMALQDRLLHALPILHPGLQNCHNLI